MNARVARKNPIAIRLRNSDAEQDLSPLHTSVRVPCAKCNEAIGKLGRRSQPNDSSEVLVIASNRKYSIPDSMVTVNQNPLVP